MHCNWGCAVGSLFVVLAGFAFTSAVMAQSGAAGPVSPAQAGVAKDLRSAHKLLVEADHDYEGHRAKAAQEVHKALRTLGYYHHKKAPPASTASAVVPKTSAAPAVHEPQAASDAQLRQAQEILQGVLTQLGASQPKAAVNVKAAIGEITTALSLR